MVYVEAWVDFKDGSVDIVEDVTSVHRLLSAFSYIDFFASLTCSLGHCMDLEAPETFLAGVGM